MYGSLTAYYKGKKPGKIRALTSFLSNALHLQSIDERWAESHTTALQSWRRFCNCISKPLLHRFIERRAIPTSHAKWNLLSLHGRGINSFGRLVVVDSVFLIVSNCLYDVVVEWVGWWSNCSAKELLGRISSLTTALMEQLSLCFTQTEGATVQNM